MLAFIYKLLSDSFLISPSEIRQKGYCKLSLFSGSIDMEHAFKNLYEQR